MVMDFAKILEVTKRHSLGCKSIIKFIYCGLTSPFQASPTPLDQ